MRAHGIIINYQIISNQEATTLPLCVFVMPAVNSHVIKFVLQYVQLVVRFVFKITRVKLSVQQTTPFDIEDSRIILHCTVCLQNVDYNYIYCNKKNYNIHLLLIFIFEWLGARSDFFR